VPPDPIAPNTNRDVKAPSRPNRSGISHHDRSKNKSLSKEEREGLKDKVWRKVKYEVQAENRARLQQRH
jgi:hypothetical protein